MLPTRFRVSGLYGERVPCEIRIEAGGKADTRDVENAPSSCNGEPPPPPPQNNDPVCSIDLPASDIHVLVGNTAWYAGSGSDPDGDDLGSFFGTSISIRT